MHYDVSVNFEGPLDAGAATGERRQVLVAGEGWPPESGDVWHIEAQIAWPQAAEGAPTSAALTIVGPMDGRLRGRYREGAITTLTNQSGESQASRIDLLFDVDDSFGRFGGSRGTIRLFGTLEPQGFLLTANLLLDAPETAWTPPNSHAATPTEAASGGAHVGSQPAGQLRAERDAEDSILRGNAAERNDAGSHVD